jgi:predicted SnoaL-like aldol condensation-catalyzing enzyme
MTSSVAVQNKAIVLKAFDTLFNERNYVAAECYWSTDYIQHSAHIEPGRDGLFNMIKRSPASLKYQSGIVMAEGDLVIVGREHLRKRHSGCSRRTRPNCSNC